MVAKLLEIDRQDGEDGSTFITSVENKRNSNLSQWTSKINTKISELQKL